MRRRCPASASSRQVAEALGREDVRGRYAPITAITDAPPRASVIAELAAAPGAAAVLPARQVAPGLWRLDILPRDEGLADSSQQLVHTVRAKLPDARVTGQTAAFVDQQASLAAHLPWALAILALTTCTLIFLFTGSVVLPLKSLIMNVLTLGAAFGILVVVFEWGRGLSGLESTQPILLCATAFGLSTDYAIFLFSRIKEARDRGLENREAVADGMERTGRVVTAAALLFCVAIGTFATFGDLVHPGARRRHRGRGRARCDDHPGAARPQPDGAARRAGTGGLRGRCAGSTFGSCRPRRQPDDAHSSAATSSATPVSTSARTASVAGGSGTCAAAPALGSPIATTGDDRDVAHSSTPSSKADPV